MTDLKRKLLIHDRIAGIYADARFPAGHTGQKLRMLAVTMTWVAGNRINPPGKFWETIAASMCIDGNHEWWIRHLIAEDRPRYVPPNWSDRATCEAPMIRREGPCGRDASSTFRVTDWATGQWRLSGWCTRHRDIGRAEWAAERERAAHGFPEPTPNYGGLLPAHVPWRKWEEVYRWAYPTWEPPKIGINRDDWPVLERIAGLEPPKLTVITGDAQMAVGGEPPEFSVLPGGRS